MDAEKPLRQYISSLNDDELSKEDHELGLAGLQSASGQWTWMAYRTIGHVLRAQPWHKLSEHFDAGLAARLEHEPVPVRRTRPAPPRQLLALFNRLLTTFQTSTTADMAQTARALLVELDILSRQISDEHMVSLAVRARDVLAGAKGRGQLVHAYYAEAMTLCAACWKRLYPRIAATGLARREQAVIARYGSARSSLALRSAMEDAGTVA